VKKEDIEHEQVVGPAGALLVAVGDFHDCLWYPGKSLQRSLGHRAGGCSDKTQINPLISQVQPPFGVAWEPWDNYTVSGYTAFGGDTDFDVDSETQGACRGCRSPRKSICKLIVANDDNYALAA